MDSGKEESKAKSKKPETQKKSKPKPKPKKARSLLEVNLEMMATCPIPYHKGRIHVGYKIPLDHILMEDWYLAVRAQQAKEGGEALDLKKKHQAEREAEKKKALKKHQSPKTLGA